MGDLLRVVDGEGVYFVALEEGVALAENLVVHRAETAKIVLSLCESGDSTVHRKMVDVGLAMPNAAEVEPVTVRRPTEFVHVALEVLAEEYFGSCSDVHNEESVLVAFVAVVLHAEPGNLRAVGAEGRVGVVAHVLVRAALLADVLYCAVLYIKKVDVAIGTAGILHSRLFAAGVGDGLPVGAPGELLHTAEGTQGAFEEGALEQVFRFAHAFAVKVGKEGVGDFVRPFVPMLIHQVGDDASCALGQVGIFVNNAWTVLYGHHQKHLTLVGREEETLQVFLGVAELASPCAVGGHFPQLV